ncbi:MAG: hypothetical protein KZQ78_13235 [Candidatus Thiodiazotropha sp. (ex Ustalcina ferruginea)]|nr:hypothetical protein [Candidatus Thiodiazotropha sp. (ex Ustalcina ferruginea)]
MRSTQAILTAIVLSFILSACGGSATPDSNQVANNPDQDTAVSNGGADNTSAPQEETVIGGQEVSVVAPPPPVKPVTPTTPTVKPVIPTTPPEDTSSNGDNKTPTDPAENDVPQPVNQVPVIGGNPASTVMYTVFHLQQRMETPIH